MRSAVLLLVAAGVLDVALVARSQTPSSFPWMDTSLPPGQRAALALKQMTLDEKIRMMHGQGSPFGGPVSPNAWMSNGGDGFSLGVPRLGIPNLQMIGSAYGVRFSAANGRYSTALPANLAQTATWDAGAACAYGALIGREERAQGYNMSLAGGVDLARELRNGRNFEYHGEDPILAGVMVGNRVRCEQQQHILSELKHYAVNDQESGRGIVNSVIDRRALRETDLLAFEIGNQIGRPWAIMCAYNGVNGDYACENKYILNHVLKQEWGFQGFVLSDWGGTHSTVKASAAGLDMEQPDERFYGAAMKKAVLDGKVPMAELDDHVRRILRAEFGSGIIDNPTRKFVVNVDEGFAVARRLAGESMVLLRNEHRLLPLDAGTVKSIAVIGEHADVGMISGGGSAQVDPEGGYAPAWENPAHVWFPTSPLKAIAARAPRARVKFQYGADLPAAAALARNSQVAIVFAHQWTSEAMDLPSLSLPGDQDKLIETVAAANPNTIVVLETGTAVTMPWVNRVSGIVEAWYAGSRGAEAVADVLFGGVNPSARLPITFPLSEAGMPHPTMTVPSPEILKEEKAGKKGPLFDVDYSEGLKVGYKWYDAEKKPVLFPFGFGLSYTTYSYSGLSVARGNGAADALTATFRVKNTGSRAGTEIAEVYASLPAAAGEPPSRLVGWSRVTLKPGETRQVTVDIPAMYLSVFDVAAEKWKLLPGGYILRAGRSSRDLPLQSGLTLP